MKLASQNKLLPYSLFFIWPTMAFILATLNLKKSWAKNIFWLMCTFTAYTLILPDLDANHDLNRYRAHFERLVSERNIPILELLKRPFQHGLNSALDFYLTFMNVIISRITSDFKIFLAAIGAVFGYFLSRNLFFVVEHYKLKRFGLLTGMIFVVLFYLFPFWIVNGYRFATASVVFIFGVLHYMKYRKVKYLLVSISSVLIHFTYIFPLVIFFFYLLIGNRVKLIFIGLVMSLLLSGISPQTIFKNNKLAPAFVQNKIKGYSREKEVQKVTTNIRNSNWYVEGHMIGLKVFTISLCFIFWFNRKRLKSDKLSLSLLLFGMLQFVFSDLVSKVPSMDRFYWVSYFMILSGMLGILIQNDNQKQFVKEGLGLALPFIFYFIVRTRIGFEEIGLNTLFLNPMLAPFIPDSPNLMEFIK